MLSRRGFMKLGTVAGAAGLVPIAASQAALGSGRTPPTGANPAHLHPPPAGGPLAASQPARGSGPPAPRGATPAHLHRPPAGAPIVTGAAGAVAPYSVQMP